MPRKTKDIIEEKDVKTKSKIKKEASKKATDKNISKSKKAEKSTTTQKSVETKPKKVTEKEAQAENITLINKITAKKESSKKATSAAKKTTPKKVSAKSASKSSSKTAKVKTAAKVKFTAAKGKTKTKSAKITVPSVVEYYDLPYKYNQTVVKVLYQNPTTLFVYWEISDADIENYKNIYGENFFESTRPVLIVHNDTMNYSFELNINDFANCWYFNINDSKCEYHIELIRRPVVYTEKIKTDYIHITSSNKIESPNDRILFSTNEPYTIYFRNTKNNSQRKVNLPKLLEQLNLTNKNVNFPIVRNVYDLYKNVYNIDDIVDSSINLTNPSSGNPSSHSLLSRFV